MDTDALGVAPPGGLWVHLVSAMPAALRPVVPTAELGVFPHTAFHPEKTLKLEELLEAVTCGWQLVSQLMVTDCVPKVSCTKILPKESLYVFV